jgi:hypothetical protein
MSLTWIPCKRMFFIACQSGANSASWKGAIPAGRNSLKQVAEIASITSEGFCIAFMGLYRLDLRICNANIITDNKQGRHAVKTFGGQFPKISKTSNSPIPYAAPVILVYSPKFLGGGLRNENCSVKDLKN